jgi:hypothetical protein
MNRSQASSTATDSAKMIASRVIKHGVDFKIAWDKKLIAGGDEFLLMNYYSYAEAPAFLIPPGAVTSTTMGPFNGPLRFNLSERVNLPGIGTDADFDAGDVVLSLPKLTRPVCVAINNLLYKDPVNLEPGSSSAEAYLWEDPNSQVLDHEVTSARYAGRSEGCVKTADGTYVYFKSILER